MHGKKRTEEGKHPRLRGEDAKILAKVSEDPRNTPAYAGKTFDCVDDERGGEKHPRLRGEDCTSGVQTSKREETPPLTRGRPHGCRARKRCCGNTPAYAGKTSPAPQPWCIRKKHPRLRGEDDSRPHQSPFQEETPPLTRGRLIDDGAADSIDGNTPAYAGKTFDFCASRDSDWKHPRLRGEDCRPIGPPIRRRRNTPAYAGKTSLRCASWPSVQKHPRLRWEDRGGLTDGEPMLETPPLTRGRPPDEAGAGRVVETPPLTRGRRFESHFGHQHRGNTPAYAGKTYP